MSSPAIPVIVPNYNHARYLHARLDSIFGHTFTDFDIVLLADCSTDDSRQILSQYADRPTRDSELFEKHSPLRLPVDVPSGV